MNMLQPDAVGVPPMMNPNVPQAPKIAGGLSKCLQLKNMFDPREETEPGWELDIKDDTEEECAKYGRVLHCSVDKNSDGHVFLCFDTAAHAELAAKALHGRWFAKKQITAEYKSPAEYIVK